MKNISRERESERAWLLHFHSLHHPSLITMRDSWCLVSRCSRSWGTRCPVTPEPGNEDVPEALCMEKGEARCQAHCSPNRKYFLAHCICIDSCTQLKPGLLRLVRLCVSSVLQPSGCTKTRKTTYVYNLKETLDIILPDLFIWQTESQRANDFSWIPKLADQEAGHRSPGHQPDNALCYKGCPFSFVVLQPPLWVVQRSAL